MKSTMYALALVTTLVVAAPNAMAATIKATLHDDTVQLDTNTASAGKITFQVTNAAEKTTHELVILKTDLAEDNLPMKADGTVDESKLSNKGEAEDVLPGKTKKVTVKLAPGHYVLICNTPGHYKMGMHTVFTVTK